MGQVASAGLSGAKAHAPWGTPVLSSQRSGWFCWFFGWVMSLIPCLVINILLYHVYIHIHTFLYHRRPSVSVVRVMFLPPATAALS